MLLLRQKLMVHQTEDMFSQSPFVNEVKISVTLHLALPILMGFNDMFGSLDGSTHVRINSMWRSFTYEYPPDFNMLGPGQEEV